MPVDTDRLVKILNMLESPFENERLTAITLAQKIVKDSGQTWEQLLKGKGNGIRYPSAEQLLNAGQARMHQEAGFRRGYQEGVIHGLRTAEAALNIKAKLDAAYKRGVKETMDKATDPVQLKHLMEQAYERGLAQGRTEQAKTQATGGGGGGGGSASAGSAGSTKASSGIFNKGGHIKWDQFAISALTGKYGETSDWYRQFLTNVCHFPRVSVKQLATLQRLADDLDTNLTVFG